MKEMASYKKWNIISCNLIAIYFKIFFFPQRDLKNIFCGFYENWEAREPSQCGELNGDLKYLLNALYIHYFI